ncbi:MAG: hypothetical protein NC918_00120 [Candidatus Omnitrophica bacterium]|nr:hypothetical protein [Candidatus Omnitrophota bacterium]
MSLINKFLSIFKEKESFSEKDLSNKAKASPFILSNSFRPIRLSAKKENSIDLIVKITNKTKQPQLCSFLVAVPSELGLDSTCLSKSKEFRLGFLEPGQTKELTIPIYANSQTPPSLFKIILKTYAHYQNYSRVLNAIQKTVELRAV